MEEITVQIHCEGKEKHEVQAPEDIVTEEFVAELVDGLRLPAADDQGRALIWEADDNVGRFLMPGRTLRENGVSSGHNLYLRSRLAAPPAPDPLPEPKPLVQMRPIPEVKSPYDAPKPVHQAKPQPNLKPLPEVKPRPEPKPIPVTPPIVTPAMPTPVVPAQRAKPQWPLYVALALIPVAAAGGYFIAKAQSDEISKQLAAEKNVAATARRRVADAELKAAQTQMQLDDLQHGTVTAQAGLQSQLDAAKAQLKASDTRLSQITAERNQLRAQGVREYEEHATALAAVNQRLQELQTKLTAEQQNAASLQTRLTAALREVQSKPQPVREQPAADKTRPRSGTLTWTGEAKSKIVIKDNKPPKGSTLMGTLPGTECTIEVTDPEVTILVPPGPKNNWKGVEFQVKGKGETTVKLNWKAK